MESTYNPFGNYYRAAQGDNVRQAYERAYARAQQNRSNKDPNYVEATILENGQPAYRQSNWKTTTAQPPKPETTPLDAVPKQLKGVAKVAGGGVLALAGLPMLILPGPGLLCLGGGLLLAASGLNDMGALDNINIPKP